MKRLTALLCLVVPGVLLATLPGVPVCDQCIKGETEYPPYKIVRLYATDVPDKAGLLWKVTPSHSIDRAETPRDQLQFVGPPGKYLVELLVISKDKDGGIDIRNSSVEVKIDGPAPPTPPTPPGPEPEPPAPPGPTPKTLEAIGRIQFGSAGCSATIIYPRRADGRWDVLTAAHCISAVGQQGRMTLPRVGNRTFTLRVASLDRRADVAWLVTDSTELEDLPYAVLAREAPPVNTPIWHAGFGVHIPGNREEGRVLDRPNSSNQIAMLLNVSSGDSGGGICRSDNNEVIANVCCTTRIGSQVRMFGGTSVRAWQMRGTAVYPASPQPGERLDPTEPYRWTPIEIPKVAD